MPEATRQVVLALFGFSIIAPDQERKQLELSAELPANRGESLLTALEGDDGIKTFKYRNRSFAFLKFEPVSGSLLMAERARRWRVGRLAKKRVWKHTRLEKEQRDPLVPYSAEDWVSAQMVVDFREQYIALEQVPGLGNVSHQAAVLSEGLTTFVYQRFMHEVVVRPVAEEHVFWDEIKSAPELYEVSLSMVSPNILRTDRKAAELLKELQGQVNQDEVRVTFLNRLGKLGRNWEAFKSFLSYISEGAGKWRIKTKGGKEAAFTSAKAAKKLSASIPAAEERPTESVNASARESLVAAVEAATGGPANGG